MSPEPTINELIDFAFARGIYITKETRTLLEKQYAPELITQLDAILKDSCSPTEVWTTAETLTAAAKQVEPSLRVKYPDLNDQSITAILNYACFQWK